MFIRTINAAASPLLKDNPYAPASDDDQTEAIYLRKLLAERRKLNEAAADPAAALKYDAIIDMYSLDIVRISRKLRKANVEQAKARKARVIDRMSEAQKQRRVQQA